MKRGDLVRVALQGNYGKPRPALVIQSDLYSELPAVTVLPLSSDLRAVPDVRLTVEPDSINNLRIRSQIMIDKANTVHRSKIGAAFGSLSARDMTALNEALIVFFGLASSNTLPSQAGANDEPR